MRYFNHDTNASSDELMIQLRLEHGLEAIAVYWTILETIYSEEKPLAFGRDQRETKAVLYRLSLPYETVENYLKTMVEIGLLLSRKYRDANYYLISSLRAEETIEQYHAKQETARQNGKKGGRPKNQRHNPEKTNVGFSLVSKNNQREKLTKTKTKGIGFDKQNLIPTECENLPANGACVGGENPTPAPSQKSIQDAQIQQQVMDAMTAEAVTCPAAIAEQVKRGVS